MVAVRSIARILAFICKLLAVLYTATACYGILVLLLANCTNAAWVPIRYLENNRFEIFYPFTHTPFLLGDQVGTYFGVLLGMALLYGGFFILLARVFDAFRQIKLFTAKGVSRLTKFYLTNLVAPAIVLLLLIWLKEDIKTYFIIAVLHFFLGIFAFFMAAIFKQGLLLQEEQDLTL